MKLQELTQKAFEIGINEGFLNRSDEQLRYSLLVAESIERSQAAGGGQLMVEADTGIGKTLGYLVPSLLHARLKASRVVVSTYTIALQKQILRKSPYLATAGDAQRAIYLVSKVLGTNPQKCALRLGKRNYAHADRIAELHQRFVSDSVSGSDIDRGAKWDSFLAWLASTQTGMLAEYLEEAAEQEFPDGLAMEMFSPAHAKDDGQFYDEAIASAMEADLLVVNHTLLVLSAMTASKGNLRMLQDDTDARVISSLIVDECDSLPVAARSFCTTQVPTFELKRALANYLSALGVSTPDAHPIAKRVAVIENLLATMCPDDILDDSPTLFWDDLRQGDRAQLTAEASLVLDQVKSHLPDLSRDVWSKDSELSSSSRSLLTYIEHLGEFFGQVTPDDVIENGFAPKFIPDPTTFINALVWSPAKHYPSFTQFKLYPARVLKRLWSHARTHCKSSVLTSATIGAEWDKGFQSLSIELGIYADRNPCADLNRSFQVKEFGTASFVLPDPSVAQPFCATEAIDATIEGFDPRGYTYSEKWLKYISTSISAMQAQGGRSLVLTTSFATVESIRDALTVFGVNTENVLFKTRQTRMHQVISHLQANANAIVISPTGWEGFDARSHGFSLDNVMVAQLPYAVSNSPSHKALSRHLASKGMPKGQVSAILHGDALHQMLRKLREGFGRGIRSYKDNFTFWVMDPRFPLPRALRAIAPTPVNRIVDKIELAIPARFRQGSVSGSALLMKSRILLQSGNFVTP